MRCKNNIRVRRLDNLRYSDAMPISIENINYDANNINWLGKSWFESKKRLPSPIEILRGI